MKKAIIILLSFLFVGITAAAYAAPVGNITRIIEEERPKYGIGVEGDYVFERELSDNDAEVEDLMAGYIKPSYGYEDLFEIYGLVGALQFDLEETAALSLETEYGLAAGLGGAMKLYENPSGFAVGTDAKYIWSNPDIDEATGASPDEITYQEWQLALGISQKLDLGPDLKFTPYGGVKYSDVRLTDATGFADNESDMIVGGFAGVDFAVAEGTSINVEGRFGDELAASAGLRYEY